MKRYLLFKTEDMFMLLWVLNELDYKPLKVSTIIRLITSDEEFEILVDKEEKRFFCVTDRNQLEPILPKSTKIYISDDTDAVLNFLEVNVTAEDIINYVELVCKDGRTPKLEEVYNGFESNKDNDVDIDEIMNHPLMKHFSSIIPEDKLKEAVRFAAQERKKEVCTEKETSNKETDKDNNFYQELVPGRIVRFENAGMIRYGIVLSNGTVMHFSGSNLSASGYINYITPERPYIVSQILKPTNEHFNLKEAELMEVVWERTPKKSKTSMTVQDIEKQLGLEPDSLNIV